MIEEEHQSFQKMSASAEEDSNRLSRHSGQLSKPLNHVSTTQHSELIRDSAFRSSFTLKERISSWLFNCLRCGNSELSFVHQLDQAERRTPAAVSEQLKKLMADRIMKLKICETSRLKLDANVMHPFVKVHIVNKNTGCYLQNLEKTDFPAIYHNEELTTYNKIEKKYESTQNDLLLPFATSCCDFRELGNSKGLWNQKFYINYPAQQLLSPDTLLLFQILDFNHQALLYKADQQQYDRNNLYRVAWSFLRPAGMAKTHLGKVQLQLYTYKYHPAEAHLNKSFIPDVYYDFLWGTHQPYEGFLQVQLNYTQRPKYRFVGQDGQYPTHLFQEEQEDRRYLDKFMSEEVVANEEKPKQNKDLYKFYRNREICEVPRQLIYKLDSEQLGCFRLKFVGNYLLAAVSRKKHSTLKVFDLSSGQEVMNLRGHRGVVYKMEVTSNERILVTAGSDHIVRISALPEYTGEFIDEDESEAFIISECMHSAAVYSFAMVHQPLQDTLYILTCCYDGYLRLWQCRIGDKTCKATTEILINDYTRSPKKVYPSACAVVENSFFLVGDSLGEIRVYDFNKASITERCLISPQQLRNDLILNIHVLNKSHIIMQASDNLIRHFDLIGNRLRLSQEFAGGQFDKELVQCALSPDHKYLLSPSESGRPCLWDVFTGSQVNLDHLNLSVKGPLVCCDWHPKYNLVAFAGFVEFCPIFVFGNVLGEAEIKMVSAQMG